MQKLIIKRSEWLRGEGPSYSYLYRSSDGKRCCLGFLGNQVCGFTDAEMSNKAMPSALPLSNWPSKMLRENDEDRFGPLIDSTITTNLSNANDSKFLPDEGREDRISRLMTELDIAVEFID
jgi:hypothetical protein